MKLPLTSRSPLVSLIYSDSLQFSQVIKAKQNMLSLFYILFLSPVNRPSANLQGNDKTLAPVPIPQSLPLQPISHPIISHIVPPFPWLPCNHNSVTKMLQPGAMDNGDISSAATENALGLILSCPAPHAVISTRAKQA